MLLLVDTNVVSELMRPKPNPRVTAFLQQPRWQPRLCVPVVYEIEFGIARLIKPEPKAALLKAWSDVRNSFPDDEFLPLDVTAARHAAEVKAGVTGARDHADVLDCMIAGIAVAVGAAVATRNIEHFPSGRIEVVNPWVA